MSGFITLKDAQIRYGKAVAVDGLDLAVPDGALVTLLGPSGCGKTTTLRTIAGLERLSSGRLTIGDQIADAPAERQFVAPENRHIGMVFQSYALWPHLSIRNNIAYPMKVAGVTSAKRQHRTRELLEMMALTPFADRAPAQLSGGQQQRVAIARALARDPKVLLFDEPLSNLDARLRRSLRAEIRSVHEQNGATSVFVTHDHEEALAISDYVAVMLDGRLVQFGQSVEVYAKPANRRIAEFFGFDNIIDVSLSPGGDIAIAADTGARLPIQGHVGAEASGGAIALRRDQIHLVNSTASTRNSLSAKVSAVSYVGGITEFEADYCGQLLKCSVDDWTLHHLDRGIPTVGESVNLALPDSGIPIVAAV